MADEPRLSADDAPPSQATQLLGELRAGHTLQPTAVVHEAFMRLVQAEGPNFLLGDPSA